MGVATCVAGIVSVSAQAAHHLCVAWRGIPTTGGVNKATADALVVCEAAGYDTLIVETVGVGQVGILTGAS